MLIHGGGLHDAGDDSMEQAAAAYLSARLNAYTALVHYTEDKHQLPSTPGAPSEIIAASNDSGCAFDWIKTYVQPHVPPSATRSILVAGYSAGGQVAAMIGSQPQFITQYTGGTAKIAGVAAMSGRYDFRIVPCCDEVTQDGWQNMHGNSTSPYSAASQTSYSYPWLLTYEQCDADTQFANAMSFARALTQSGTTVYNYEGHATGNGMSTHGEGIKSLAGVSSKDGTEFLQEFEAFESAVSGGSAAFPSPNPLETIPSVAAKDVAVGGDGSLWLASYSSGQNGDQPIEKYTYYFGSGGCYGQDPPNVTPGPSVTALGVAVAVDSAGSPWIRQSNGHIATLFGGLTREEYNGSRWSQVAIPVSAVDVGAGGPYGGPSNVWMIGVDGNAYKYDPSSGTWTNSGPPNVTLDSSSKVTVDRGNHVWIVNSSNDSYYMYSNGTWTGPLQGSLLNIGGNQTVFGIGKHDVFDQVYSNQAPTPVYGMPKGITAASNALGWPIGAALLASGGTVYQLHGYVAPGSRAPRHHHLARPRAGAARAANVLTKP